MSSDLGIREAAIRHCRTLSMRWGEAVPYAELKRGFPFGDTWIMLTGPQGVFKPKELRDGPLTLLSTLASTYADEDVAGDIMLYDYAPPQRDYENEGLKRVAALGRPVILLKQVKAKPSPEYMVFAPVALLAFDDVARKVRLDLGAANRELPDVDAAPMIACPKARPRSATASRCAQRTTGRTIVGSCSSTKTTGPRFGETGWSQARRQRQNRCCSTTPDARSTGRRTRSTGLTRPS